MITLRELRLTLETIMEMIKINYHPQAKYDTNNPKDVAMYKLAKRVYEEADELFYSDSIDYGDDDDYYEDLEAIDYLREKLECEIEMMEEDLNI